MIVGLNPEVGVNIIGIRDVAIAAKAAVIWLDASSEIDCEYIKRFFSDFVPGKSYYIGWWTDEGAGIRVSSEHGITLIPADFYDNYSIHASFERTLDIPKVPPKPKLENKFYIAFSFADGDNLQYIQHTMKGSNNLYSSRNKGKVPISWTISPVLFDAGPQILNWFYKNATPNDCFITGPSGAGYTNPIWWNIEENMKESFYLFTQATENYLRRTGIRVATIWTHISDEQESFWPEYVPSLYGITLQERFGVQQEQKIINGKMPLLTTYPRYDGDAVGIQTIIEYEIDIWDKSTPVFMMPQAIPWEIGVREINRIAENLEIKYGDDVVFIRADHMMMLYSEFNNSPYNIALHSSVTASGHYGDNLVENAVDGSWSNGNGWICDTEEKWLIIDLNDEYIINRYCIMNAGAGSYNRELNTRDFKIESSIDGKKWTDVDVVNGNESNIVDKYVVKFTARFIRLTIYNSGSDGIARIQEFEVYGNKV